MDYEKASRAKAYMVRKGVSKDEMLGAVMYFYEYKSVNKTPYSEKELNYMSDEELYSFVYDFVCENFSGNTRYDFAYAFERFCDTLLDEYITEDFMWTKYIMDSLR